MLNVKYIQEAPSKRSLASFHDTQFFSIFFFFFSILLASPKRGPRQRETRTTLELPFNLESLINEESDRLDRPRTLITQRDRLERKKRKDELQVEHGLIEPSIVSIRFIFEALRYYSLSLRFPMSAHTHAFSLCSFFFFSVSLDKSFRFGPEKVGFIVDSTLYLDSISRPSSWWKEREGAYGDILS